MRMDDPQGLATGDGVTSESQVVAVCGSVAGPDRTTVSIGLAAALGVVAPTVLVDADVASPSIAAALDADPTRNVAMLSYALGSGGGAAEAWNRALAAELQPLHPSSPRAWILCGLPKAEMRSALPSGLWRDLAGELRHRFRYVVLDAGPALAGADESRLPEALSAADCVLLVAPAHVVGLHHTRRELAAIRAAHAVPDDRLGLVLNDYDRRYHHAPAEVESSLQVRIVAVLPHDHAGVQRALAEQRPIVVGSPGGAGKALRELATGLHRGLTAPPSHGGRSEPTSGWTSVARRWSRAAISAAERLKRRGAGAKSGMRFSLGAAEAPLPDGRTAGAA